MLHREMKCIVDRSLYYTSVLSESYAADLYSTVGKRKFYVIFFVKSHD